MRVLLYHRVAPASEVGELTAGTAVDPEVFDRQMALIRDKVIPLDELVAEGADRTADKIAITFDDGYADNFTHALPILRRHRIPATVFISTGHIDNRSNFWWDRIAYAVSRSRRSSARIEGVDYSLANGAARLRTYGALSRAVAGQENRLADALQQIEEALEVDGRTQDCLVMSWEQATEMRAAGIRFGSHTANHRRLALLDPATLREELRQSHARIQEVFGGDRIGFAYPYGRETDYTAAAVAALAEQGFAFACTAVMKQFDRRDSTYEVPRINVSGVDTWLSFHLKTATPYPALYHRARIVTGRHKTRSWDYRGA